MAYELFVNKAAKFGSPTLTIRAGRIAFNADAGDILARLGVRFAHVLWDPENYRLAIKPTGREDDNTFKVLIPPGKRGGVISAQSFLSFIHWQATKPVVVAAEWDESKHLLEAVLPKANIGVIDARKTLRKDVER